MRGIGAGSRSALLVLAAAAFVLGFRVGDPPSSYARPNDPPTYVYDECYQAFTAHRYAIGDREAWNPRATRAALVSRFPADVTRNTAYEWVHPPTAKLVMAAFIRAFGFRPTSYRLGSLLFGLATLLLTWFLARAIRGERFALYAAWVLASDGMFFVMSRVAMNDIYATACIVAAMLAFFGYWTERARRGGLLLLSGALFGLGLSMKWTAGPLLVGCGLLALGRIVYDARRSERGGRALARDLALWIAAFLLAPAAIYVAAYTPYFWSGYSWSSFVTLNREIWYYHHHLAATHARASPWYDWPLDYKPVWFYSRVSGDFRRELYAMGNPIVWWLFLPALSWTAVRFARRREPADGLILCGFCGAWLPWMFVGRVTFLQYLLPAVPFGILAILSALDDAERRWGDRSRAARWLLPGYALASTALFFYFYPIWSALPIRGAAYFSHRWFWIAGWR